MANHDFYANNALIDYPLAQAREPWLLYGDGAGTPLPKNLIVDAGFMGVSGWPNARLHRLSLNQAGTSLTTEVRVGPTVNPTILRFTAQPASEPITVWSRGTNFGDAFLTFGDVAAGIEAIRRTSGSAVYLPSTAGGSRRLVEAEAPFEIRTQQSLSERLVRKVRLFNRILPLDRSTEWRYELAGEVDTASLATLVVQAGYNVSIVRDGHGIILQAERNAGLGGGSTEDGPLTDGERFIVSWNGVSPDPDGNFNLLEGPRVGIHPYPQDHLVAIDLSRLLDKPCYE